MSEFVVIESVGQRTKRLRFNRPERANALNQEATLKLIEAVAECYMDGTKLLILSGTGKHFCSGFDRTLSQRSSSAELAVLGVQIEVLLQLIWSAPFVTVAVVHGSAVGAGADIVVACDYRLATPDTVLLFPGFRMLGVSLGNRRLAQAVGSGRAIEVICRSRRITQAEAVRWGLLIGIEKSDDVSSYISELEEKLADIDEQSIPVLRTAIRGELPGRPMRFSPAARQSYEHA